ncbi:uncharacterized protein BT62DRAFT_1013817 [Guyanagaster necrorhizus]|uniref:Uncharacterized protein n=1 Tax=Guyanagaster necrorhizus TaxID=856835 RepID=A0A9P8AL88_9AGAR|nr:uncharacterized protein BT62DRAFT_1013817 [Guyanagaster necrorhizus MCA 3950]KAG7439520.1 hypothetical protein BT62DRAFT_1013817 [Guyanagaster necrorhizus MCA 3950]
MTTPSSLPPKPTRRVLILLHTLPRRSTDRGTAHLSAKTSNADLFSNCVVCHYRSLRIVFALSSSVLVITFVFGLCGDTHGENATFQKCPEHAEMCQGLEMKR